ncbi:unnamed protein product [Linum tenue]|uniref:Uncharacterized protein n=1 Tax=Linum tenue TaxID=586396 RepID=A0AAV0LBZ8_9ROSI|nr:unnamed protein product [Linum tenue]
MPGNEVGDRIHNFFGQETSSPVPQHSQIADAAWPGMSGNPWAGSQGQIATPFISDLINRSLQQSVADYERGYGGQSSPVQHDLSFQQSIERTEPARSQSQDQQPTINGYFQGHQGFQMRQNETNFLGMDTESDRHNLTPKGFSAFDSHQGNCPDFHKRNLVRMDSTESPVNFDSFGGQHQMSPQHPGILQSLHRQPLGIGDMQLLQQQLILKQMQEFQRQRQHHQQLQQQESTRQLNILNHVSSLGKHALVSQSQSMINGIPVQDASGYLLQPEVIAANTNWQQHSMSPDMRGSSSGLGFSLEQNQALHLMGVVPQKVDQSLYGVPISGTRVTSSHFSPIQMDKAPPQQMSSNNNSLIANQYTVSSNKVNDQEGPSGLRQGFQGGNVVGRVDTQGVDSGVNLECLQQVNSWQSSVPTQEFLGRQDGEAPSIPSQEKTVGQAVSSQNATTLDPTEERILYGSDDNLWDAFGNSDHVGSGCLNTESTEAPGGALSFLQSGTWSALMQSAVAEASSVDVSTQEEWSGPGSQCTEPQNGNRLIRTVNGSGKQQTAWAGNSFQTGLTLNNPFHQSDDNTGINSNEMHRVNRSGVSSPHDVSEKSQMDSFRKFSQQFVKSNTKWLDGSHQQKAAVEVSHNHEKVVYSPVVDSSAKNISHPWANQAGSPLHNPIGQSFIRQNGWNFIDSASSNTGSALKSQGKQNPLQAPATNDLKSSIGKNIWRPDPVSNSAVGTISTQSSTGSPPVNTEDSSRNSTPGFSSMMLNQHSSRDVPQLGNNLDVWKHADPVMNHKGREITESRSLSMEKSEGVFESSGNLYASSTVSTEMDIAAFGRSLRPNASLSQNYSLLHQVQDVKNREVDQSGRSLKRPKGSDGSVDPQLAASEGGQQLFGHANTARGALLNNASSSPDDPKAVGFSGRQTDVHGPNLPSQDMHEFGGNSSRNFADSNDGVTGKGDLSQISPQMAPSWFNQYGTFKNGQVLSTYDARKVTAMKHAELALSGGRSSNRLPIPGPLEAARTTSDDANQHGLVRISSTPLISEEFSFPQLSRPDSVGMSLFVVRPKKRKSVTCDLVPWHKEVIKIPHRLPNMSLAEVEWAKAVHRLTEKVEDDGEIVYDGPPAIKSKKRLMLTTQLMQILLHPPPSWVMSAHATSQYDSAAHCVARLTLGDVCCSVNGSASHASPPSKSGNIIPERLRISKTKSDQYFSKVMEDLIERTIKVESDLLRLDRSMSVLDLRVECEDLEKFSVINRFAKFHGPGQTAGGAVDTSSSGGASNAQKAFLQRYVTALPFPRNIPDRVQCLSL